MTHAERAALLAHPGAAGRSLTWDLAHPDFAALKAGPCPLLDGRARCAVYAARPYNCRRFACFRPNPAIEPLEFRGDECVNLLERMAVSRAVRRAAQRIMQQAQGWARRHGWKGAQ